MIEFFLSLIGPAAFKTAGEAICATPLPFLGLALILAGLTVLCCNRFHSRKEQEIEHQRSTLNDRRAVLEEREKNVALREDKVKEHQVEFERMKEELSSPIYQLYKAKVLSQEMDETTILQKAREADQEQPTPPTTQTGPLQRQ